MSLNFIHSTLDKFREWAPVSHTSTFRSNGQITPEEFVAAGDYLVYKFPTWSWADASPISKRVAYLPAGKQFLVTRGVPCHRRLDDNFAGEAGHEESVVGDGEDFKRTEGATAGDDEDGWLRTGGLAESMVKRASDVRTVDESGEMGERVEDEEDDIPDMEDDEDDEEAIIRDPKGEGADAYVPPLVIPLLSAHVVTALDGPIQFTLHTHHTIGHRDSTSRDIWHPRNHWRRT